MLSTCDSCHLWSGGGAMFTLVWLGYFLSMNLLIDDAWATAYRSITTFDLSLKWLQSTLCISIFFVIKITDYIKLNLNSCSNIYHFTYNWRWNLFSLFVWSRNYNRLLLRMFYSTNVHNGHLIFSAFLSRANSWSINKLNPSTKYLTHIFMEYNLTISLYNSCLCNNQ